MSRRHRVTCIRPARSCQASGAARAVNSRDSGADRFAGPAFHSAQWDRSCDLSGKRVAVIGTGASAIQFIPQIAKQARQVYVFQRTPPWLHPRPDFEIPPAVRAMFARRAADDEGVP